MPHSRAIPARIADASHDTAIDEAFGSVVELRQYLLHPGARERLIAGGRRRESLRGDVS